MEVNQYLSVLLIAITCCQLYIAYLAWKKRQFPTAYSLFLGMCAGAFYSFGYAFEIVSSDLAEIEFWLRIEYIGISFGTLFWFIMVLHYTGYSAALRKWGVALLSLIPIVTLISHYTNPWHHLFYKKIALSYATGFPLASITPGPFYFLHVIYSYGLIFMGMFFLMRMYHKTSKHMKNQVATIALGSAGIYGLTLLYLLGILKSPIDLSPFGFLFTGVLFIWGIYQYNMLKLVPYALQKVFDSMQDAVIVLDLDLCISSVNQSAQRLFPTLQNKGMLGRQVADVLSEHKALLEVIHQGVPWETDIQLISGRESRYYHLSITDVENGWNHSIGKMLLLNDMTATVQNEQRLLANAKQLGELNTFKDNLFRIIAHDIRDPLSILMNLMEILREELEQNEGAGQDIAQEMEQQIQNTFTLVENLLDWFRSHQDSITFNPLSWNLAKVVQKNVDFFQLQSTRKQLNISCNIPADLFVYADKEMLELIIRNLLSNAIKFTDYKGHIYLNANKEEDKVIVSVQDTGEGIPPNQSRTLLKDDRQKYPTASKGTAGERGIGIGLTLCQQFVQINGGDMWFESKRHQGSTFYFSTPAVEA
ncbi:two-component sensor histidine kinase [Pullulanibacillus camelliae]|uniref:histidine kinase n=1 Tax=Pullulanibacillus camelliae TaxID=1707096 RepID=A0A8J3E1C2_9BACL|nr:histidine kinase N-terminal 7TM domain-containing protein [Pullulanibacillus camelliae]GGE53639.1 two-component sensor histidine kinase [Pullulanibacillus camelliae]